MQNSLTSIDPTDNIDRTRPCLRAAAHAPEARCICQPPPAVIVKHLPNSSIGQYQRIRLSFCISCAYPISDLAPLLQLSLDSEYSHISLP
jgi:hypothetical protein